MPFSLIHWDNFGFDGPAPLTTVTHNYVDAHYPGGDYIESTTATQTIEIPDSVAGAVAARLMFVAASRSDGWYFWNASDSVTVNGVPFSIPNADPTNNINVCVAQILPLPLGTLHTGTNTVQIQLA